MANMKKRFAALVCAAAMVATSIPVSAPITANAQVLEGLTDLGRQVAAEGCVLIKNDNNVLPLENGVSISIFGRAQCNYYKSGTGSGGDVKAPYAVGILEGLRKNPKVKVNEDLAKVYADWVADGHGFDDGGGGWAAEPWYQAEMPLSQDVADAAKEKSDVAVVLIGRTAGEDKDGANTAGSYQLTDTEKEMLQTVTTTFDKVAVVLNVPAIIDMNWMDDYDIDSVLYAWQGGMNGGDGVADVLTGDVNPSGRLTDTIAKNYSDYPSAPYFGRTDYNFYVEDIYVGYRYFETFAQDKVVYPFGYGMSYTTFETSTYSITESDGYINVFTTVENTGDRAGKETVQVYYGAPQGKLGKPAKELAAFAKTKLLQPGESQDITLSFKIDDMASYDDGGYTGYDSAYVLEAGDYNIYVGNDVRDSQLEYVHKEPELRVVEQLEEEMAPVREFERFKPVEDENGDLVVGFEAVPTQTVDVEKKIAEDSAKLPELQTKDDNHYDLIDVYNGEVTTEEFVAQLTNTELTSIVQGEGMSPSGVTSGIASAFGGVNTIKDGKKTTLTELYGIPRAGASDGPSGIRQTAAATSLPGGASIACTWNTDLVERMFQLEGEEMVLNEIDTLLGPGINIHRNPLNGRNFEYYSEDPLVTGKMAAAVTKGIQSTGATVTIKHFAGNNQETNRHNDDSRISERALREIYLKGFEIAVKEGKARSVMTAYNPINGCWTASNYDLTTDILRGEWGYDGVVMTDWWARMNQTIGNGLKTSSGVQYLASMVKAQNDMYMVTPDSSTTSAANTSTTLDMAARLEDGYITRAELQRCAVNICNYLLKSQCFARLNNIEFIPYDVVGEEWFKVEKSEFGDPRLESISVGGNEIASFKKYVLEYSAEADAAAIPEVTAVAAQGTEITIQQATADSPVALIRATAGGEETIYRVLFTLTGIGGGAGAAAEDIKIDGVSLEGFDPSVKEYAVPSDTISGTPEITADVEEGVTVTSVYHAEEKTATVTCTKDDQETVYTIRFGSRPQSDEFESDILSSFWTVEKENENWELADGHLTINTEGGSFYEGQNDAHNQFVQQAYGDWESITKLDVSRLPYTNYQSLGVVAKQDDDNYINLKVEWSSSLAIGFTQEVNGSRTILAELPTAQLAKFTDTVYFKLTKKGNTYTAAVSPDGETYIRLGAKATADYSNPLFGICAANGSVANADSMAANYDYVRFTPDPAAPVITIGDSTKLKVAEAEPSEVTSTITQEDCEDEDGGFDFGNCNKGEYAVYDVNVEKTGVYDFTARMASGASETSQAKFIIYIDGEEATNFVVSGTGGWQNWVTSDANKVRMTAGAHKLKVYIDLAGLNLNWIQMELATELNDSELKAAVEAAEEKDITSYPAVRQEAFEKALAEAESTLNGAMAQDAIDAALAALKAADENLTVATPITSIEVNAGSVSLNPGTSVTVSAAAEPAGYTETLVWSSSDETVVSVEDGVLTGVGEGSAVITVSNGADVKTSFTVTVKEYAPVEEDALNAAVEAAEAKDISSYPVSRQQEFAKALAAAKEVLAKEDKTQEEVDAAVAALEEAEANLGVAVPMTGIKLTTDTLSLNVGTSVSLSAVAQPSNTTEALIWSSSDAKIVTVKDGLVTAAAEGTATVTVSNGGSVKAEVKVTVAKEQEGSSSTVTTGSYINNVKVSLDKNALYYGGNAENTAAITVTVPNGAVIESVDYMTGNAKAATVNAAGKVTAVGAGSAKITAKVTLTNGESKQFSFDVTVKKAAIQKVKVPAKVKKGKKVTLKAKALGSTAKITWTLKNPSTKVAKLTAKGKFTAKKKGKVKVIATSGNIKKTFTIKVK